MSDEREPTRWLSDKAQAPDGFEDLVRADAAAAPSAAQLARVVSALGRELGQPELAQAYRAEEQAARGLRASTPALSSARLIAGVGLLSLLAAVWFGLSRHAPQAPLPASQKVRASSSVPSAPVLTPRAEVVAPETPKPVALEAPAAVEPPAAAPRRAHPAALHSKTPDDDPLAELALLEPAQRTLRAKPAQALALAERHRARFPHGQFEQEREMLAIEALVGLGRNREAVQRGAAFERRHPDSSHLPHLRDLLRNLL